jgi:chitinase
VIKITWNWGAWWQLVVMGSLIKFHFPRVGLLQNIPKPYPRSSVVSCGLRGGPRKPLWRKTMMSSKSIQAVHSLKLARSSAPILQQVFNARLTRLLKANLLDTLAELQRQNHLDLALQVFWMEKVPWTCCWENYEIHYGKLWRQN